MRRLSVVLVLMGLCSCGAGTIGLVSLAGGGGGGGNALAVTNANTTGAEDYTHTLKTIGFDLNSDASDVAVQLQGRPILLANGQPAEHLHGNTFQGLQWNYGPDSNYRVVDLDVLIGGRVVQTLHDIEIGNDPPDIPPNSRIDKVGTQEDFDSDGDGVADSKQFVGPIQFTFQIVDPNPTDLAEVRARYRFDETTDWQQAPTATLLGGHEFSVNGPAVVVWDAVTDARGREGRAQLLFILSDVADGNNGKDSKHSERETNWFLIDYNARPQATLFGDAFFANPDDVSGIPIPFRIVDEDSPSVDLVFQWRLDSQADFPALPSSLTDLRSLMSDPIARRSKQIATERPLSFEGTAFAGPDDRSLRIPHLLIESIPLLASAGVVGRDLDLMRPRVPLQRAPWSGLDHPVGCLPLRDGLSALVLDRAAQGSWRLREIDLGSGGERRVLVDSAPGGHEPVGMAFEAADASALILDQDAQTQSWQLFRLALGSPTVEKVGQGSGYPARGVAGVGGRSAAVTAGSSLFVVHFPLGETATVRSVLADLDTPWGLSADHILPDRVYLAEGGYALSGPGHVVAVDLLSGIKIPVVPNEASIELPHPQALCLERNGARLIAVVDVNGDGIGDRLRSLDLGGGESGKSFDIEQSFDTEIGGIETGVDDLRIALLPQLSTVALAGGVGERHEIVSFDRSTLLAQLAESHGLVSGESRRWRILQHARPVHPGANGIADRTFVWDVAADVGETTSVELRLIPFDNEVGLESSTQAGRVVRAPSDVPPTEIAPGSGSAGILVDLDGDTNIDVLDPPNVYFQDPPGTFVQTGPVGVAPAACADFNGDGRLDLVCGLAVYYQVAPRTFQLQFVLDDKGLITRESDVAVGDIDGDGVPDVVASNGENAIPSGDPGRLVVFYNNGSGQFPGPPLEVPTSDAEKEQPLSVAIADLNDDGLADFLAASAAYDGAFTQGAVTVFEQVDREHFVLQRLGDPATNVRVADLDGNGLLEFVSNGHREIFCCLFKSLRVYLRDHAGDPLSFDLVEERPVGFGAIAIADHNHDGLQDVICGGKLFTQLAPTPTAPFRLGDETVLQANPLAVADVNGDGAVDIGSNSSAFHPAILYGDRTGMFSSQSTIIGFGNKVDIDQTPSLQLLVADFEGDGDVDIAVSRYGQFADFRRMTELVLFLQTAPRVFSERTLYRDFSTNDEPSYSIKAAADMDQNGLTDLIFEHGNELRILLQTAPGVFEPTAVLATGFFRSASVTDLDGDGLLDFVLAINDQSHHEAALFFQRSPGVFERAQDDLDTPDATGADQVACADLDADGVIDVVADHFVFFDAAGSGVPLPESGIVRTIRDVDGNGLLDLVLTNGETGTLIMQPGPRDFAAVDLESAPGPLTAADAADLDRDGDVDIVLSGLVASQGHRTSSDLTIDAQTSPGAFSSRSYPSNTFVVSPIVDLDGDSEPDIVGLDVNELRILYGGSANPPR